MMEEALHNEKRRFQEAGGKQAILCSLSLLEGVRSNAYRTITIARPSKAVKFTSYPSNQLDPTAGCGIVQGYSRNEPQRV
jgi:hypothetical protein